MGASDLGSDRGMSDEVFASEQEVENGRPREGLPPGYRMRAETHYVDTLISRRERFEPPPRPAADIGDLEPDVSAPPSSGARRRSDRVLARLGDEIAAIVSAAALLDADAAPLARQAGQELIRAQAWRAAWLLKASLVLDNRHILDVKPTRLTSLVEQLHAGLVPECRLSGITLSVHAPDVTVLVDAPLISTAVTGAVVAVAGLVGGCPGAAIRVTFDVVAGQLKSIDVAQDLVRPAATLVDRFFDAGLTDRPGGWTALMGAVSANGAARLTGGSATFAVADGGSRLRLRLSPTV
jgi:hypothetical protein